MPNSEPRPGVTEGVDALQMTRPRLLWRFRLREPDPSRTRRPSRLTSTPEGHRMRAKGVPAPPPFRAKCSRMNGATSCDDPVAVASRPVALSAPIHANSDRFCLSLGEGPDSWPSERSGSRSSFLASTHGAPLRVVKPRSMAHRMALLRESTPILR